MANISNINDFFIVDSVGLKAAVGADLANGNGSPYVGTDFTVVGRDASSPVANLWLSNFTHKSYILISDNSSNFIIRDSGAGNRLTIDSSGNSTFAGTITGPGATFNTAVDTVGLGVYTSGESTTPNVRFGRDDSQYVGFKIADRVNSIIFRQDETTGDFTSELNLWSSTTGNSFFTINKSDNTGGSSSTWLTIENSDVNITIGTLSIGQSSENNISNTTGETWIGSNGLRYNSGSGTFARSSATAQAAMIVLTDTADTEFYAQPSTSQTGTYALTPKMVIKGATGNVGIGTDNPSHTITINKANTASLKLSRSDADTTYTTILTNYYNSTLGTALTSANNNILTHGNSGGTALNFTNASMRFNFRDVAQMTIDSSGNVGIGTVPVAKLDIKGANSLNALKITDSGGGNGLKITSHTTQGTYVQIFDASGTQTITLDGRTDSTGRDTYFNGGGNFGIGTTGPDAKLEVANSATGVPVVRLSGFAAANSTAYSKLEFYNQDGSGQGPNIASSIKALTGNRSNGSGGALSFSTSNGTGVSGSEATERMLIGIDGFTTITTNGPGASLTISQGGSISINENVGYLNFYSNDVSTTSSGGVGGIGVYGETAFSTSYTPTYMSFFTHAATANDGTVEGNVTERMRITSGGSVLIGTDTTVSNGYPLEIEANSGGGQIYLKRSAAYGQIFMGGATVAATALFIRSAGAGGVKLLASATAWASASDESLKENIKPLENVLDKIKDYRCVEYNFKTDKDKKIGFIAQDWKNDFPAIVDKDDDGLLGMKYTETIPILLKAIQELKADNDSLKARIETLENN